MTVGHHAHVVSGRVALAAVFVLGLFVAPLAVKAQQVGRSLASG